MIVRDARSEGERGMGEQKTPDALRRLWVVTDGRAGNENPARGLAERLARRLRAEGVAAEVDIHKLRLKRWSTLLPAPLWPAFGARQDGWPFTALAEGGEIGGRAFEQGAAPSLLIGAGRRAAPIVAAIGALSAGAVKTVQLLDPKMNPERFDMIIAPQHDVRPRRRRFVTVGSLHRIDPAAPPAPDARLPQTDAPKVAMLIGGKSKSATFGAEEVDALLRAISALADAGATIAATASRRTPPADAERLRAAVEQAGGFFWDGVAGDNPYLAMLFWADALIVTADSVNMASEACAFGKPVFVAPARRLAPKFRRFHLALQTGGHARLLTGDEDFAALAEWRPTPLNDMDAATDAASQLLTR